MLLPLQYRDSRAGGGFLGVQVGGRCCCTLASALGGCSCSPRLVPLGFLVS